MPSLKRVVCHDLAEDKAQDFADWAQSTFGIVGTACVSLEDSLRDADVVTVAASRRKTLHVEDSWFKCGATVLLTGPMKAEESFWLNSTIVYDNIRLQEAYVSDAMVAPDKLEYYDSVIGGPLYRLIDDGKLPSLADSTDLGNVILGKRSGRDTAEERVVFIACGMAVFDVAWGYELYEVALRQGLGQRLLLWEDPYREEASESPMLAES